MPPPSSLDEAAGIPTEDASNHCPPDCGRSAPCSTPPPIRPQQSLRTASSRLRPPPWRQTSARVAESAARTGRTRPLRTAATPHGHTQPTYARAVSSITAATGAALQMHPSSSLPQWPSSQPRPTARPTAPNALPQPCPSPPPRRSSLGIRSPLPACRAHLLRHRLLIRSCRVPPAPGKGHGAASVNDAGQSRHAMHCGCHHDLNSDGSDGGAEMKKSDLKSTSGTRPEILVCHDYVGCSLSAATSGTCDLTVHTIWKTSAQSRGNPSSSLSMFHPKHSAWRCSNVSFSGFVNVCT